MRQRYRLYHMSVRDHYFSRKRNITNQNSAFSKLKINDKDIKKTIAGTISVIMCLGDKELFRLLNIKASKVNLFL